MKRKIGFLIALVAMLSMLLVPAGALADDINLGAVVYDKALTLDNKDSSSVPYQAISDLIGGTLLYNDSGASFAWSLTATVAVADVDYALIYYADKPDRFNDWGGNNPGRLLGTIHASGNSISASGTAYFPFDLPCPLDANQFEYNYGTVAQGGTGDGYINNHGAKIWLVLASDYVGGVLTGWNPDSYLFETDLIWFDRDGIVSNIVSVTVPANLDFGHIVAGTSVTKALPVSVGNIPTTVTVINPNAGLFAPGNLTGLPALPLIIEAAGSVTYNLTLAVPVSYTPGTVTGKLTFMATATEPHHTTHPIP